LATILLRALKPSWNTRQQRELGQVKFTLARSRDKLRVSPAGSLVDPAFNLAADLAVVNTLWHCSATIRQQNKRNAWSASAMSDKTSSAGFEEVNRDTAVLCRDCAMIIPNNDRP
jgi:hypothetical protein